MRGTPLPSWRWLSAGGILIVLFLLPQLSRLPAAQAEFHNGWDRIAPRLVLGRVPTQFVFSPPPDKQRAGAGGEYRLLIQRGGETVKELPLEASDEGYTTPEFQIGGWGHCEAVIVDAAGSPLAAIGFTLWPGLITLLPPFIAIAMALITRQVLVSLLLGIWVGAVFINGPDIFAGSLRAIDTTIVGAIANSDHVKVLLFTLFLGGMVGVMSRSGGTLGIVQRLARRATTPRRGALAAWFLGLLIFFDDYANTIIIGPTLRPITDRLKLSREKLAYLVDATAAPVASIALISTWIGTEVGLIGDALHDVGSEMDAYKVFLETLPYRFYPILALVLGFLVAATGRDWGPMLKAEIRARTGQVLRPGAQ
ncbi:MAG: hypothetical protein KJ831_07245, partial [Candidatus Eisenbacteria bacterium]|nr:hypothetical protein [Candidatus Eisenbacteria bacterium]